MFDRQISNSNLTYGWILFPYISSIKFIIYFLKRALPKNDKWTVKQTAVYIHNGVLLNNKKGWNYDKHSMLDEGKERLTERGTLGIWRGRSTCI